MTPPRPQGPAGSARGETPARVLLVDDEDAIVDGLAPFLQRCGFEVHTAPDGVRGLEELERCVPDIVVSDIMMPHMDGREMVRRIRARGTWTPVILLTRIDASFERSAALDEGADDYLSKPFDPQELVSRIRAVLRRTQGAPRPLSAAQRLVCGDLVLDRVARRAHRNGRELELTPKAMMLLDYLMTHPGELHTRERLLSALWGIDFASSTRAVDHRIREIRSSLGEDAASPTFIETVPSVGYRFMGQVLQ
ncbi:response regulator transcription factor [Schaalia sp. 19OD2882]|uniref:response regulator transcription factor n=1 Tax=Schaalia sp. 19OD2882 TaxID=2794089 RepID=UPI001C1F0DBA|nr:response regulator transcription factor [Schaalia sp. 19OD2882]QWW19550.1 response regulator transcription factor [Schaalia sp. 19OD2882]